jgi:hypothetical protein
LINRIQSVASFLSAASVFCGSFSFAAGNPPLAIRTVALSGDPVPGGQPGETLTGFTRPVIDPIGRLAFRAGVSGPGVGGHNNEGYWWNEGESLELVVRKGSQVPNMANGVVFSTLDFFPLQSDAGTFSFGARVQGPGITASNNRGIFFGPPGNTIPKLRTGDPPPGFPDGSRFNSIAPPAGAPGDTLAFEADIFTPGQPLRMSLWSMTEGAPNLLALQGEQVPGATSGYVYSDFFEASLATNRLSQTLVVAQLEDQDAIGFGYVAALHTNSGMSPLAITDNQAPGLPAGALFQWIYTNSHHVNDSGQTAFTAMAARFEPAFEQYFPIYAGGPGSMRVVTMLGEQAPGLPPGVVLTGTHSVTMNNLLPISDSGRTAFKTNLQGPGVTTSNNLAIFSEGLGDLALVVRESDQAPGALDGALFKEFSNLTMMGTGQLVLTSTLMGSNIDTTNDVGLWAQDPNGLLSLIVREGDPFAVAPGDVRTVSFINFAPPTGGTPPVNNRGEIALHLLFTDGSSGIFVARIPEPGTFFLFSLVMSICGLTTIRRRTKQGLRHS